MNRQRIKEQDVAIWVDWVGHRVSFKVQPIPLPFIIELNTKVQAGELDAEEALKQIFDFCLLDWRGIEVKREYQELPEYRRSALDAFWENLELRSFVLDKVIGELSYRTFAFEEWAKNFERFLLASGKLKS